MPPSHQTSTLTSRSGYQIRTLMYVIPQWGDVGSPFPSPAKKQYHIY